MFKGTSGITLPKVSLVGCLSSSEKYMLVKSDHFLNFRYDNIISLKLETSKFSFHLLRFFVPQGEPLRSWLPGRRSCAGRLPSEKQWPNEASRN